MMRVYQKLKSEGIKEYKEKQCFTRALFVSSVAIITINSTIGTIRATL
jgi:hypothetical protein